MKVLIIDERNSKGAEEVGSFGDNWTVKFSHLLRKEFPEIKEVVKRAALTSDEKPIPLPQRLETQSISQKVDLVIVCGSKTALKIRSWIPVNFVQIPSTFFLMNATGGEWLRSKKLIQDRIENIKEEESIYGYQKEEKTFSI